MAAPITVELRREQFDDYVSLEVLETGISEELEAEELRAWFEARGANMAAVEAAMDDLWNLERKVHVKIANPRELRQHGRATPNVA